MILNQVYPLHRPEPLPRGMKVTHIIMDEIQDLLHTPDHYEQAPWPDEPGMTVMQYLHTNEEFHYQAVHLINRVPRLTINEEKARRAQIRRYARQMNLPLYEYIYPKEIQ